MAKTVLTDVLNRYRPEDIYNTDEFGLFWKLTPDKTMAFNDEKVHGSKKNKNRITVLSTVSMSGENLNF